MLSFSYAGLAVVLCFCCQGTILQYSTDVDEDTIDELLSLEATVRAQQEVILELTETYTRQSSEISSLARKLAVLKDKEVRNTTGPFGKGLQTTISEDVGDDMKNWNTHSIRALSKPTPQNQPVAFYSIFKRFTSERVTAGDTIPFNDVHMNLMNGYDSTRGVFVTPVSGVYLFSVSLECYFSTLCKAGLTKNGQIVAVAYSDAIDYDNSKGINLSDQGAITMALSLTKGDEVWVKAYLELDQLISGERSTVFTGVMIWAF